VRVRVNTLPDTEVDAKNPRTGRAVVVVTMEVAGEIPVNVDVCVRSFCAELFSAYVHVSEVVAYAETVAVTV
jgi:uncharacterized ferredoxin-like protein